MNLFYDDEVDPLVKNDSHCLLREKVIVGLEIKSNYVVAICIKGINLDGRVFDLGGCQLEIVGNDNFLRAPGEEEKLNVNHSQDIEFKAAIGRHYTQNQASDLWWVGLLRSDLGEATIYDDELLSLMVIGEHDGV